MLLDKINNNDSKKREEEILAKLAEKENQSKIDTSEKQNKKSQSKPNEELLFNIFSDNSVFGPIQKYVEDEQITDIDFNSKNKVWLTNIQNERWFVEIPELTDEWIRNFAIQIADHEQVEINPLTPVVETETEQLRISVVHSSIATNGTSICIRKTPPKARITEKYALDSLYCTKEVLCILANCVKAHLNIVFCGEPRAGKTECAKFISTYIPDNERVITIESVKEWRYKELKPEADCVEMRSTDTFDYSDAIVASLKQNPKWLMIAETRSDEVKYLIQGFSTGVNGITTLHTDDIRKIPSRMLNMVNDSTVEKRFLRNIYEFVNVGIMINLKITEDGKLIRFIDQIGFFTTEGVKKAIEGEEVKAGRCVVIVQDGRLIDRPLPENIVYKLQNIGVTKGDNSALYKNKEVDRRLAIQSGQVSSENAADELDIPYSEEEIKSSDKNNEDLEEKLKDMYIPKFD